MAARGEGPADLASRLPAGSYAVSGPVERSGLMFAHLRHDARDARLEAGMTPAADVLSLHLSTFHGRTWREGRLIGHGPIRADSLSLARRGVRADVSLSGRIDIVQVFLPEHSMAALAAEMFGRPLRLAIDGWIADRPLQGLVMAALRAIESGDPAAALQADVLALRLAGHMLQRHGERGAGGGDGRFARGGLAPWQMRRLADYIEAHLDREIRLEELAGQVHLSPFHFVRAFHAESGLTPHQWLVRRRVARAKALLSGSPLSLAEIALAVGYASQSAMTAMFSKIVGVSPGRWRDRTRR